MKFSPRFSPGPGPDTAEDQGAACRPRRRWRSGGTILLALLVALGPVAVPAAPAQSALEEIFGGKKKQKPARKKRPGKSSSKVRKQPSQPSQLSRDKGDGEEPAAKPSRSPGARSSIGEAAARETPAPSPAPATAAPAPTADSPPPASPAPPATEGRRKGTIAAKKAVADESLRPLPEPTANPTKRSISARAQPSPGPTSAAPGGGSKGSRSIGDAPTPPPASSLPGPAKGSGAVGAATAGAAAVPAGSGSSPAAKPGAGVTASISTEELREFSAQPERIQRLIESALSLTRRRLIYAYGSADPEKGGMDCSGTIYFLLHSQNFADVPRQANEQYVWVRKKSRISAVVSRRDDTFEINELQPGDLLFWTGTYGVDRDPPVTHAMMYLGTSKKTGRRLMFGASNGRTFNGERQNGVSVFDFKVSSSAQRRGEAAPDNAPDFVGYGPIPGLR